MTTQRVIKKYPNRRLYDTEQSRYITLADVRGLVLDMIDFVVIDKKSGANITRSILLQVIIEREQHGEPVMSEQFLSQVIRSQATVASGSPSDHLEQSLHRALLQPQGPRTDVKRVVGIGDGREDRKRAG